MTVAGEGTDPVESARAGTLVLLHGYDDDPTAYTDIAARLAPPGFRSEVPTGPIEAEGRRSWFDGDDDGVPDAAQVQEAIARVDALVMEAGADGRPVVVVGFSQGGALALLWALRVVDGSHDPAPPDLAALAVVAGWLPSVDGLELDPAGCRAARVLIAHGDDDETVAPQLGRGAARLLERHHIDTTVTTLAAGHDLEPFVATVREFLTPPR